MAERPEEFYSKCAERFAEDHSIEKMPKAYIELLDRFVELIGEGKVLDAGCGHGRDVEYFIENGLDAVGVDLADKMIEYARENKKGDYYLMDISDLGFRDENFDGVWCNTVTQFFPPKKIDKIVSELQRVLKPEGIIHITFKIGEGKFTREKYGSKVGQYLIPEEEAKKKVRDQNLRILETERSEVNSLEILHLTCRKIK